MTLMEVAVDPLAFTNWVQVAALFIIVAGGIIIMWFRQLDARAKATSQAVDKIEKTLTTNNGGSHIKDQLDRLEQTHEEHLAWSREFAAEQKEMQEKLNEELAAHTNKIDKVWKTVSPESPDELT